MHKVENKETIKKKSQKLKQNEKVKILLQKFS